MSSRTHTQMGANEALFRKINEAIERGQWPGEERRPTSFRCECAQLGCTRFVELTLESYEEVRSDPRRFIVIPGHERPEVESVVAREPGYFVVEKRGDAAEVAEETDPRT